MIDNTAHPTNQARDVEIYQQPQRFVCESEVRQKLSVVDRHQCLHRFQLDNHLIFD